MISAVQTSQPVLPDRRVSPGGRGGETPPHLPVRGAGEEQRPAFREQRGFGVSGGTLVAAQEEAGKPRHATEEAPKPDTGLSSKLSDADRERVQELQAREREVRAHEQAHARVGGQHAGSPEYQFERGPDGKSYAVGGSVSISTAPVPGDPQATVQKMEQVKRAALAPAEPSGQDRRVAADAEAKRTNARAEIAEISREEMRAEFEGEDAPDTTQGPDAAKAAPEGPVPLSGSAPFGGQDEEDADAELKTAFGNGESDNKLGDSSGFDDSPDAVEGVFGTGRTSENDGATPFSQQIESFTRTLERGINAISGFAGGISQLEMNPATQAEAQTTTRRTGVDIRV